MRPDTRSMDEDKEMRKIPMQHIDSSTVFEPTADAYNEQLPSSYEGYEEGIFLLVKKSKAANRVNNTVGDGRRVVCQLLFFCGETFSSAYLFL